MTCSQLNTRRLPKVNMAHDVSNDSYRCYRHWNDVMRPWKLDAIQKNSSSKHFVDSKNSTVSDCVLLFVKKLYSDDPYNKIFTMSSSQWFNKVSSRLMRFSRSFVLCSENKEQRKRYWPVVSVSALQRKNQSAVSRKLYRNLCSFRWLKLILSLLKSLIPMRLSTSKIEFSSVLKLF